MIIVFIHLHFALGYDDVFNSKFIIPVIWKKNTTYSVLCYILYHQCQPSWTICNSGIYSLVRKCKLNILMEIERFEYLHSVKLCITAPLHCENRNL